MMSSLHMLNFNKIDTSTKPPASDSQIAPRNSLRYQTLEERLKSFDNWPHQQISKESLAAAGFYYKKRGDVVQCPFCYVSGYNWKPEDDPLRDHRSWSPNCWFFKNRMEQDNQGTDVCGPYSIEDMMPNLVLEGLGKLRLQKTIGPVQPSKHSIESRLATFTAWPKSMRQTPQQLAEAGLYYLGIGDQTMCFYCGIGLRNWEQTDDPWEEHAKFSPSCNYLHLTDKGQEHLKALKEKNSRDLTVDSEEDSCTTITTPPKSAVVTPTPTTSTTTPPPTPSANSDMKALCKICYKNEVGVIFLPCGHMVACVDCAVALNNCPICRKPFEATFRAFLS